MTKDINNTQKKTAEMTEPSSEPTADGEPISSNGLPPDMGPSSDESPAQDGEPAPDDTPADPPQRGGFLEQLSKYFGVSFTQTFVEFGVFAALHGLGLGTSVANVFAITCSASYNFIMNRNITFKSSSNLTRSIVLFVMLYCWNLLFSSTCLAVLPDALGWSSTLVKLLTMACQGIWGFLLSRYVIFR